MQRLLIFARVSAILVGKLLRVSDCFCSSLCFFGLYFYEVGFVLCREKSNSAIFFATIDVSYNQHNMLKLFRLLIGQLSIHDLNFKMFCACFAISCWLQRSFGHFLIKIVMMAEGMRCQDELRTFMQCLMLPSPPLAYHSCILS